ncbi:hypothetical protein RB597_010309 [Gaeumannomyces tritici]
MAPSRRSQRPRTRLLELSHPELVDWLRKYRRPDGTVVDDDSDWHLLPADDLSILGDRLLKALPEVESESAPVDAGQLGALLEGLAADETRYRRAPSKSTSPSIPEDTPAALLEVELESLAKLVHDGGRPAFSADLAEQVYDNPAKFLGMLRPWLGNPDSASQHDNDIFGRQLDRWKEFRRWQRDNRGMPVAEEQKHRFEMERIKHKEVHGDHDFSQYASAVKRRLERHGFTLPFRLDQDPTQQGTWETWVEYLAYECWWLDCHRKPLASLESRRDKTWKGLQVMGLLGPSDSQEYFLSSASARQRQIAVDRANNALKSAELAAREAPSETANQELDVAQKKLAAILERKSRIRGFKKIARRIQVVEMDICRQTARLEWVREQLRQIKADERKRPAQAARSTRKRRRATLDDDRETMEQVPAAQRPMPRAPAVVGQSIGSSLNLGAAQPLRRSKRIAERRLRNAAFASAPGVGPVTAPLQSATAPRTSLRRRATAKQRKSNARRL